MNTYGLIITAAGDSRRFNHNQNKQFFEIDDEAMIIKSLKCFFKCKHISECIVTMKREEIPTLKKLLTAIEAPFKISIIEGGNTRKNSVQQAFSALSEVDKVIIHDGARPFLSEALLSHLIEQSKDSDGVIPGIVETDTIKIINENRQVEKTLDRNQVYKIQTPQIFSYGVLKEAYNHHFEYEVTDEAMLLEALGKSVKVIDGEDQNIKITTLNDTY